MPSCCSFTPVVSTFQSSNFLQFKSCVELQVIKAGMGSLPFFKDEEEQAAEDAKAEGKSIEQVQMPSAMPVSNRPAVLADGSYATQSALSDTFALPALSVTQLNLR